MGRLEAGATFLKQPLQKKNQEVVNYKP